MSVVDEIQVIIEFLCRRYPHIFKRISNDSLEISDPREAIVFASNVEDSFFLRDVDDGSVEDYHVKLPREFNTVWASDLREEYPAIFEGKKIIKFFAYWIPVAGYTGKGAEYRFRKRHEKMLKYLRISVKEMGRELSDVLLVPYYWYSKGGYQFSEKIYHYLIGSVFRDMGYLVYDEYVPWLVSGKVSTPDLSAFKTPQIEDVMTLLRRKGIISNGAFQQELQLYTIFGKITPSSAMPKTELTDAKSIVIEVERSEQVRRGSLQLANYMADAYGFYDEGYLAGPFIEGEGVISFGENGELIFIRPKPRQVSLTEYWRERKRLQMEDVKRYLMIQLLKNLSLEQILSLCENKRTVWSYMHFIYTMDYLEVEEILNLLKDSR